MSGRQALLSFLLAGALCIRGIPAKADVHPNTAPGFPVDQSFHVGEFDNVNLFNGALTLTIPIGPSYPVDGGFSYGLKLVYNSNPWIFKTVHYTIPGTTTDVSRLQAIPSPCSNAGLGWRVSLGRVNPPCQVPDANDTPSTAPIYQDENGTDHVFYPMLHAGDPKDALPAGVAGIQYTRDGSYLRMKIYPSGQRDVEFPDGSVRHFGADGMPTRIQDPFGNSLAITYGTDPVDGLPVWVLQDSHGRVQKVHFRTDLLSLPLVSRIDLTAFGAATATYQFTYDVKTIGRACPHSDADPSEMGNIGSTVSVPLLTGVILPDLSRWTAQASDYSITPSPVGTYPDGACTENAGEITALALPTGGKMQWTWQKVYFPSGSTTRKHLQTNPGVATRTMLDAADSVLGTWTYLSGPGFPAALLSSEHSTTVVDPLGNQTVNYFSTSITQQFLGWSIYDYSLPFTRNQTLNVTPQVALNLSRQVYDHSSPRKLLRSEYVLYERDPVYAVSPPDIYNLNRRPLRSRTVYNDDGGVYGGVVSSGFDGLGHYRTQQTEDSFPDSNVRTHFADYNSARGTYTVNGAANTGAGYSLFPPGSAWVLEAPASLADSEVAATAQTELCYAPGSTTVTRKRVHRQPTQSPQDLVSAYDLVQGNAVAEKSYGGDNIASRVATGDLCTLTLPAPEYEIDHTYASGVRATSKYARTNFYVLNQTIDASTGLPSASADSAGLTTYHEYDALGRLTWSKPAQGGWTQYVYTPAGGGALANAIVRRRANGSVTAPILAVDQVVFDAFGRVSQEFKNLPDGTSAKRQTTYDAAGNKSAVSEWTVGVPRNQTSFLNYDPFGRPGTIRPPDGAAHDVTMTYHGLRQVDRTVSIATSQTAETAATTTEIYDAHGRLLSVTEPSGNGGAVVTTTYGYDVGNRLASVSTTAGTTAGTVTQTRGFSYDLAGLLQSETHPEKGSAGNGTVSYLSYDSRGHDLRKLDGANDLTFGYDAAERLSQVQETGTSGRLLKAFTYASANGANDWSQGKLQQASRYNYVTIGGSLYTVQVAETYTYGGKDGRVSQRDTQTTTTPSNGVAGESFTQGFTYTDLGQVNSLSYPLCTHAGCTQPAAAVFADAPVGYWAQREIEAIYAAGVTTGCNSNPLRFCPDNTVTRAEMAAFLIRASSPAGYTPPAPNCAAPIFADVPCSQWAAAWIEEVYRRGITTGCAANPLRYCPDNQVINSEMAAFLLRSKEGSGYTPPACSGAGPFADIPCTYWDAAQIAEVNRRGIMTGCGGGSFCPVNAVTRAQMAGYLARTFDIPVATAPTTPRSAQLAYTQGLLTGVASGGVTYGTISYYPNLLVSQIAHGNGVTETQGNDPNEMRRPSSLAASGPWASWSSGAYSYDGSGNVKTIGTSWFSYDAVSRLVSANLYDGATGGGNLKQQSYSFDAFGNLQNIAGTSGRATPTSSQTNRLSGAATYDAAGNLTTWNGATYTYDHFNQMIQMSSGAESWAYLYTADDERIWSFDLSRNVSHWTVRDLGGKVLREYLNTAGRWSVGTDYLYRDGLLLAAETQTGQRHFHLDHLGTPRLITRASGDRAAYHVYYPFGEEATAFNQDTERMKFTGHERDLASPAGAGDDLDYMHARHESPVTGRFLSVDPMLDLKMAIINPQAWNRYAYVRGNPQRFTDPAGKYLCNGSQANCGAIKHAIKDIRSAATYLSSQSPDRVALQKILTFYGREGVDNGVTIHVGSSPGMVGGSSTVGDRTTIGIDLNREAQDTGGRSSPTFGPEIAATLAHEGQHGIDQRRDGMPSSRSMEKSSELRAARTEAAVWEGLKVDSLWGTWTQATGISVERIGAEAEASTRLWCHNGGNCH